jgi:alkylation response protein AidB-like acyl-CoA dehydrogenase
VQSPGNLSFEYTDLAPDEVALRDEVRAFLAAELPADHKPGLGMSASHDPGFSKKMAERGWLGMALPRRYGGHGRRAIDRFLVVEEMLRAGAPLGAHWVADRQTGPTILAFGTEEQKERFLPEIAAGECWFSIGMSEPDAGSDLAGVRTTGTRTDGGWLLNGTKIWTSGAHQNHWFIVLCRTSPNEGDRHQGLSQMIVDLRSSGLKINPIRFLDGSHHFNEVVMTDVFVPDELVLGEIGRGWQQVNSELAYERAGPDRYLSSWQVFRWLVDRSGPEPPDDVVEAGGRITARYWALRQLSMAVSRAIDAGRAPALEAAVVKDLGTTFEQEVIELVRSVLDHEPSLDSPELGEQLLAQAILTGPSFTIRGGTTEILRTIAAKGLRR